MFNFYSKWLSAFLRQLFIHFCMSLVFNHSFIWNLKRKRLNISKMQLLQNLESKYTFICALYRSHDSCMLSDIKEILISLTSKVLVFFYLKGISKCKPLPYYHNPWTTSICAAMVFSPSKTPRCLCVRNCAYSFALIEVCQSSFWWGKRNRVEICINTFL